jgi:hypothetical protein
MNKWDKNKKNNNTNIVSLTSLQNNNGSRSLSNNGIHNILLTLVIIKV